MSAKISAGVLIFGHRSGQLEVLLVHPGGPFWKKKDEGSWSIPKGEPEEGEDLLGAALRELHEEIGLEPQGTLVDLGVIKQRGGKTVHAWAIEADPRDAIRPESNTFQMEWPPHSGKIQTFPEIDRAQFFSLTEAEKKINQAQRVLLERLRTKIGQSK